MPVTGREAIFFVQAVLLCLSQLQTPAGEILSSVAVRSITGYVQGPGALLGAKGGNPIHSPGVRGEATFSVSLYTWIV